MTIAALKQKRANKLEALQAIQVRAANENRDLNTAEVAEWEAGEAEVRSLDTQIGRAEFLAQAERRADAEPLTGDRRELADVERRFQISRAIEAVSEGRALTGPEAEYAAEHRSGRAHAIAAPVSAFLGESRAQTTDSGPAGGYLAATQLGALIDRNRPKLMVEALGATVLAGLTSFLDLPRLASSGSATWVGEDEAASRSTASFEKLSMGPKTVAAEYQMSRRMLIQGTAIESILRRDVGFLLAQALDAAAIAGAGNDDPLGILKNTAVQVLSMGTNGAALGIDTAADMIGLLEAADAMGAPAFLTNSKVKKAALKIKDGQGNLAGIPMVFRNEQIAYSNQVPSNLTKGSGTNLSAILYGVWSDLVVGYWSSVDIVLNPYHSDVASKGGALLHAFLDADIALRHEKNFVVAKDVVAA